MRSSLLPPSSLPLLPPFFVLSLLSSPPQSPLHSLSPSRVDPDSPLFEDMKKLKETEGMDHILLHAVFDDKFPYSPPFLRVVRPVLNGGYVLAGGAICMELLTPQGWSSAYTVEAVILQIGATFVKGKARIIFSQSKASTSFLSFISSSISSSSSSPYRVKPTHCPRPSMHTSHLLKFMRRVVSVSTHHSAVTVSTHQSYDLFASSSTGWFTPPKDEG